MTWKEFKDIVEAAGVTDDMFVEFIDADKAITVDDVDIEINQRIFSVYA